MLNVLQTIINVGMVAVAICGTVIIGAWLIGLVRRKLKNNAD